MKELKDKFGRPTLSPLKFFDDQEYESFLISLPGVGKKIARCIMLYSLNCKFFQVDTHCWRICKRLGWIRPKRRSRTCTPHEMDALQSRIPKDVRFSLHVNMISLGRHIYTYYDPKCSICPHRSLCKKSGVASAKRGPTGKALQLENKLGEN